MTARRASTYTDHPAHDSGVHAQEAAARRLQPLFLASAAIRGAVALLFVFQAVYVLQLLGTSDLVAWLVLGLTSAGLAIVLLDDALDVEGKVAEQAARAAVYDADRHGARSEAVLDHADSRLRLLGRLPSARTYLRQPDTHEPFRVYFPSRRAQCKGWVASALLGCLQSALRLVALSLLVVVSVQFYFLTVA